MRICRVLRYLVVVIGLCVIDVAQAQYYSWGADAPTRWRELRSGELRVIAPDTATLLARRVMHYAEAVSPYIGATYSRKALRMPFVMHTENFDANGLAMYLPKRIEFLSLPATESYSMPWVKQLVAHEYRHAAQYGNLHRGLPRILSWLGGQQGSVTSLLFMPLWALEGDAVLNETLMSSYGRGLQPSFSMAYRAIGEEIGLTHRGKRKKNIDRWFSGSYRDHIPNHYALGYQLLAYAYDRYDENMWDRIGPFAVRNPYCFATTRVGMKRFYDTTPNTLFHDTFTHLNAHWKLLSEVEENSHRIVSVDSADYTTYRWPLQLNEAEVVALKTSYAKPSRLVTIDSQGNERLLARVGTLSSRPALQDGVLYWTEYEQSNLFEERVNSQLWQMDTRREKSRPKRVSGASRVLYPTPTPNGLAYVEYRPEGRYVLRIGGWEELVLPIGEEIHGLAWDAATASLYALLTNDEGMSIVTLSSQGVREVTRPAYVTLSDLRAENGVLYFGSIASGKDEIHSLDLANGVERTLSRSRYGAFAPAPSAQGVLLTTYSRKGYHVARLDAPLSDTVEWQPTPRNVVNPSYRGWETINLDTVRFTTVEEAQQAERVPVRRFGKVLRGINLHSWAPLSYDPYEIIDNHEVNLNLGATLLSQNLLSNTEGYLTYGWSEEEGSIIKLGVRNSSLGLRLGLDFLYGGGQEAYSVGYYDPKTQQNYLQPLPDLQTHYSLTASATLPLIFERGGVVRSLSVGAAWNYANSYVADFSAIEWKDNTVSNLQSLGYNEGIHKLTLSASVGAQRKMAYRDFLPRLGYQVMAAYAFNPTNSDFASMALLYGNLYLPGVAPHHSLQIEGLWQDAVGGYRFPSGYAPVSYKSARLVPRGFSVGEIVSESYAATSINYRLPLCYPEWGIPSVLFIKRIRLGVGFDGARFRYGFNKYNLWSAGGELAFDFNVLRMPDSATSTVTFSLFRTSNEEMWYSLSLGLPF